MSIKILSLCVTCLSDDRNLVSLNKMTILTEELEYCEVRTTHGGMCWECCSILTKMHKFKLQAQIAQESLIDLMNSKKPQWQSLTKLSMKFNLNYDYEVCYKYDPLTSETSKVNIEIPVKEEPLDYDEPSVDDSNDNIINENDIKNNENIKINDKTNIINKAKVNKIRSIYKKSVKKKTVTKKRTKDTNCNNHEGKFIKVVFTDQEMVKNREEKRCHPNFKKIPYKCDTCVLGFTRKDTYDVHMAKKHDESIGPHMCDVCQIRFSDPRSVQKHREKHYICYKCKLCKHESSDMVIAVNHCRSKHSADEPDKIHCSQCNAVVKTPEDLENHIQTQHKLYCAECGVKFKRMSTLRRHEARIHAVKREFICDICTKTFPSKTRLESHIVSHNSTIAKKLAYCHTCNVQYKNIYVYRNHLKYSAIHSERAFSCSKCNKKFASKVYWKRHYTFYHLKKSPFHCEICNKLFISHWRLTNHRQKHHGLSRTRDHSCNVCGKKFFTMSTLRAHKLTHSEQRSYMCEDCGDTFKQRPALYNHAKLVHGTKGRRKK